MFIVVLGLVVLLMAPIDSIAVAGDYPERPVEVIVPWGVGGGSTQFARVLTQATEKFLGKPLPIINIPGGGGNIGMIEYLKRPADGYSIMSVNSDIIIATVLGTYKHTWDELNYIVRTTSAENWIFVGKDNPFTKFEDVVE